MKTITKTIDLENDLTVFTVVGKVTANEIAAAISDFYESDVTSNVLWDLNDSDLGQIDSSEVKRIANLSIKYAEKRSSGKTAIVGSADLAFGLSRMYEMTKEFVKLPFETQAFRDTDEAYKWLQSDRTQDRRRG
jgi:hypothetical protein